MIEISKPKLYREETEIMQEAEGNVKNKTTNNWKT